MRSAPVAAAVSRADAKSKLTRTHPPALPDRAWTAAIDIPLTLSHSIRCVFRLIPCPIEFSTSAATGWCDTTAGQKAIAAASVLKQAADARQ
ncbi:unnamed protein product [Boreogadus saida]